MRSRLKLPSRRALGGRPQRGSAYQLVRFTAWRRLSSTRIRSRSLGTDEGEPLSLLSRFVDRSPLPDAEKRDMPRCLRIDRITATRCETQIGELPSLGLR